MAVRTLHAAELAGLDPADLIRTAITSRDLTGSRDIAAVLDARIRQRVNPLLPQPQGPWSSRVPEMADPDRHAYLAQIASMMDDRTRRLGQHTTQTAPAWAITALGPVPAPAARDDWERKGAAIAAYRETYGYDHPGDPIGPEPSHRAPAQRAFWREAFAALGPVGGPGVRVLPDGRLWLLRDTYAAETAWAPRGHLATPGRNYGWPGLPPSTPPWAPSAPTPKPRPAARPATTTAPPASYRALRDLYQHRQQTFAQAMADRQEWEQATARSRHLAIAAAAELRRRHPDRKIEPLRSAEPALVSDTEREQLQPVPDGVLAEPADRIRDLAAERQALRAKLDERQRLVVPGEDLDWDGLGEAMPSWRASRRDPILPAAPTGWTKDASVSGWRFSRLDSATEPVTCCLAWCDPNVSRIYPCCPGCPRVSVGPALGLQRRILNWQNSRPVVAGPSAVRRASLPSGRSLLTVLTSADVRRDVASGLLCLPASSCPAT